MDILDELNEQQQQAVAADLGQVLVLAGPGSGKTRVLTLRIAYLVHALKVQPYHICAVTFTNKAAREMKNRLDKYLGSEMTSGLWLGTFHSICARILRREGDHLPFTSDFIIYDSDDQLSLIKRAMQELNVDEKRVRPNSIHASISSAKNQLIWPNNYPRQSYKDEVVARVFGRYQQLLEASRAVDFDDLLIWPVRLFEEKPELRERYARRFEQVLVDEFQDTNTAQYQLLQHLSSFHKNLFAVGDEDQSIYRWRGADYRNVLRFEKDFPECTKILLEQNYRSTQNVLDVATAVIDRNKNRTRKELFTERGRGDKVVLYEAPDDNDEASYVVDTIRKLLESGKVRGGDCAVMYRTNAQSRLLEDAFMRAGMAYRLVGAQRFYGRREIKDVVAYLRLVHNLADEVSLQRIINVPARKIGDKTLAALLQTARQANLPAGELLIDLGQHGEASTFWPSFSGREARMLEDFGRKLAAWRDEINQLSLPALFDRILEDIRYRQYIEDDEEGEDRWDNVEELRKLAYEYEEAGLTAFLENLALVSDQDTLPEKTDAPTLLTLHAAKGLEFPHVFIVGLDDGLLPHSRSMESDDPEEMAEERRLFYVGITRAIKRLYLVRAEQRTSYGNFKISEASRFLADIPDSSLEKDGPRRTSSFRTRRNADEERYPRRSSQSWTMETPRSQPAPRWEQPAAPARSAAIIQPQFKPNQRVRHATYGEGIVLESRIDEGEELVDVHFESVGFKRLMASLAKLETIE